MFNLIAIQRYNINRNVDQKIFILDFGLQICLSDGDCILDDYLLKQFEFPIPLCGDFVLPGKFQFNSMVY